MGLVHFAGTRAALPPRFQELARAIERADACVGAAMTLGHEDVASGIGDDVVGLIERRRILGLAGPIAAGFAERQEQFAIRAELVDLVPDDLRGHRRQRRVRRRASRAAGQIILPVRDPHVSVAIDVDAVW